VVQRPARLGPCGRAYRPTSCRHGHYIRHNRNCSRGPAPARKKCKGVAALNRHTLGIGDARDFYQPIVGGLFRKKSRGPRVV
jgi:hypothetical protein